MPKRFLETVKQHCNCRTRLMAASVYHGLWGIEFVEAPDDYQSKIRELRT